MVKSTRSNDVRAFFAPFMVGDPSNKTPSNKFKHEVSDKQNPSEKHHFFDLKGREEIVRDILDISQSVDQARLRLTRTEFDQQENGRLSRVFVQGGIISRWKFDLDQDERDNSHFVLSRNDGEGMAEIEYEDPDNPPAPGRYHIHLRAVANDGTGMVIERPYTVWVLQSGQQNVAFDLDTTSQAGELPVLTTARPNRTH